MAATIDRVRPAREAVAALPAHVLVVDERPQLAALSAVMLADLGHQARWCADAHGLAERLASPEPIDLLMLPVTTDPIADLCIAAAARERRPSLRVLFTAGSACRTGHLPFDVLVKPYGLAKLGRKVGQVLG